MVGRVVVVGAGVYGAAVAASLADRGARVTVVDAGAPAGGTSGATFSWTNSCGKQPRSYHDLNVAGMAAHRRLAAQGDWYHEGGNLEWAGDAAGQRELRRKVASLLDYGYEARWLDRAGALVLEPDLDPASVPADGIAYFPREGWVEPARLIGHLLSRAVARGAEVVRDDAVTGLDVADGAVRVVRLASGRRLPVDAVVNCAGPQAAGIAELAGLALPMRNTRGVLVYTSPVAVAVSRVVHAPEVHLRPDGAGRLVLHTHQVDGAAHVSESGRTHVDPAAVDAVLAAGRELYPGLRAAAVVDVRVGERPIPGDGLPVLGRVVGLPNFHFAVSHSGATLSVHAGDLVGAEVLGEDRDDALAPFRFERFLVDLDPQQSPDDGYRAKSVERLLDPA
ncbi:FAD-dependent oxidoreductase [Actinosynnema sp. NPDC047251]|uniref:FAD dependent oxidoreductase n=1 Tax=Saccharothrix espanaensis (strain ATCC 51144 / DSM 44229 / JCM 9112 / NBRC 15066 / NRRL 15764) TaxID=1179773 RepID=K0K3P0_SACES|nr:FAD-dependent oxidoreductase [Saccharothrix espanaensis]CCH31133.1 FAD dependent oxidoreductase [Saccharothrix espanaensis DSM 44229]